MSEKWLEDAIKNAVEVHISQIRPGDTILHMDGMVRTVCPKNLWVNVKDRLPKPEQEVLLYNSASIQHYVVGWLRKNKGYNKSQWCITNGYVTDEDITHWMPIVQPNN